MYYYAVNYSLWQHLILMLSKQDNKVLKQLTRIYSIDKLPGNSAIHRRHHRKFGKLKKIS